MVRNTIGRAGMRGVVVSPLMQGTDESGDDMLDIAEVDALEALVLVDNVTDSLSSNPPNVLPEWSVLFSGGKWRLLAGSDICCAHHGLSVLLTATVGGEKRTLLFDAGPASATFLRNTEILGVDFARIEAVVLSHGHWDPRVDCSTPSGP